MSISKRTVGIIGIPIATWLVSVGVAELAFRAVGKRTSDDQYGLYQSFGEGGYRHNAFVATTANWYNGDFCVYTDGLGLRCGADGRGAVAAGGQVDFLLLGDSQTFSSGVPYENSIGGTLQASAARRGWNVANAAISGHLLRNQFELARWLRQEQHLQIGTVVVLITPHLIANVPAYTRAHVAVDGRLYQRPPGIATRVRTWLKTHSSTYIAVRDATRRVTQADLELPKVLSFYDVQTGEAERADQLHDLLGEIEAWATGAGSQLLLAYAALPMEAAFDEVEEIARAAKVDVSPEVPWQVAVRVSQQLGLPLLDLRPALVVVKARGQALQLEGDPFYHYSAAASQQCGQQLWSELNSRFVENGGQVASVETR